MDTKRCLSCHKLLRADAQKCSLCGYVFIQTPVRRSSKATNASRQPATASFPSNAPASPHRAGHYSGLHPEDQPYQSSFMPIMRPPAITRRLDEQESEDVLEPVAVSSAPLQEALEEEQEQTLKRYVATPVRTLPPMPQRSTSVLSAMHTPLPLVEVEPLPLQLVPEPTLHEQITAPLPIQAHLTGKHQPRGRITRVLFIAAILSFLVASSILMYLVVFAGTGKQAHPSATVAHSGNQQGQLTEPQLQLSTSHIDFGTKKNHNVLTLTNAGGQQVNWLAGVDSSWLSISPPYDTFTRQETVTITVDRSNLAAQAYIGYVDFFQQGANTLRLKVTMSVNHLSATVTASPPPILTVSPSPSPSPLPGMAITPNALTFNAIQGKNPAQQTFILSNPGNAALKWAIANANTLLSISPNNGTLTPGGSIPISVTPNVGSSKAGVYNATLTIQDTDPGTAVKSQQVAVKITISNQALISVSTTSIPCNLSSTVTTSSHPLNITNSGSATLSWTILPQSLPSWISIDNTSGTLPPGYTAFVNIACNNTGFQAGTSTYTLVVSDSDAQTPVAPQNVLITLTVT